MKDFINPCGDKNENIKDLQKYRYEKERMKRTGKSKNYFYRLRHMGCPHGQKKCFLCSKAKYGRNEPKYMSIIPTTNESFSPYRITTSGLIELFDDINEKVKKIIFTDKTFLIIYSNQYIEIKIDCDSADAYFKDADDGAHKIRNLKGKYLDSIYFEKSESLPMAEDEPWHSKIIQVYKINYYGGEIYFKFIFDQVAIYGASINIIWHKGTI